MPVNDLLNFIVFLSVQGLSGGTISSYISGDSYHNKIQGIQDTTKFFIIGKALEGIKRIQGGKRNDIRAYWIGQPGLQFKDLDSLLDAKRKFLLSPNFIIIHCGANNLTDLELTGKGLIENVKCSILRFQALFKNVIII